MWSLLLPPSCGACGRSGSSPCDACWRLLRPAPPSATVPGVERCRSLLIYEGTGRELLARFKYRNSRDSIGWLSDGMAALAAAPGEIFDVVTWAPTSGRRRRRRGFDQAELLARAVGRRLGVPARRLLVRLPGPAQTGRGRFERGAGPRFRAPAPVAASRVLLVDDVVTTGATIAAAAGALLSAGAESVDAVTAGRTPLKVARRPADA